MLYALLYLALGSHLEIDFFEHFHMDPSYYLINIFNKPISLLGQETSYLKCWSYNPVYTCLGVTIIEHNRTYFWADIHRSVLWKAFPPVTDRAIKKTFLPTVHSKVVKYIKERVEWLLQQKSTECTSEGTAGHKLWYPRAVDLKPLAPGPIFIVRIFRGPSEIKS